MSVCLYLCALSFPQRQTTSLLSFCHFLSYICHSVLFHPCLPVTNLANTTDISLAPCTTGKWDFDWFIACRTHGPRPGLTQLYFLCHGNSKTGLDTACARTLIAHSGWCMLGHQNRARCASVGLPQKHYSSSFLGSRLHEW